MRIVEQWKSLSRDGLYEVVAELDPGEDPPRPGGSVRLPGLARSTSMSFSNASG